MNLLLKKVVLVAAATFSAGCAAETQAEFEAKFNGFTQEVLALYPTIIEQLDAAGLSEDDLAGGQFDPLSGLPTTPGIPAQTMTRITRVNTILNDEVCGWLKGYVNTTLFNVNDPAARRELGFAEAVRDEQGHFIPHANRVALTDEEMNYRMGFLESRRLGVRNIARKILGLNDRTLEQVFTLGRQLTEETVEEHQGTINQWKEAAQALLVELAGNPEDPQHEIGVRGLAELGLMLHPELGVVAVIAA